MCVLLNLDILSFRLWTNTEMILKKMSAIHTVVLCTTVIPLPNVDICLDTVPKTNNSHYVLSVQKVALFKEDICWTVFLFKMLH